MIAKKAPAKPVPPQPLTSVDHARELLRFLEERKTTLSPLLILPHDFPDQYAIATALAYGILPDTLDLYRAYRGADWCLATGRFKGREHVPLRTVRQDAQAGGHGPIADGSCRVGLKATEKQWIERERRLVERLKGRLRIPARIEPRKPFNN